MDDTFLSQDAFGYGNGVAWDVRYEIRTASNVFVRDISDRVEGCVIDIDPDKAIVGTAKVTLSNPLEVQPYEEFLAPVVIFRYVDGRDRWEYPVGLYQLKRGALSWDHTPEMGWLPAGSVTLDDLTGILSTETLGEVYNVNSGVIYTTAARIIIQGATLPNALPWRFNVPASVKTVPSLISVDPETTRGSAAGRFYNAAGMYSPWAGWDGAIRTFPYRDYDRMTPSVTYVPGVDDRIIVDSELIKTDSDDTNLKNRISVIQNDTDPAKRFYARVENLDPNSPARIGGPIGLRSRTVQVTKYQTQAEVTAYAKELASKWGTLYETGSFQTNLEPEHEPYELLAIDLSRSKVAGDFSSALEGRWRQTGFSMDLTRGRSTFRIARTVDFTLVQEGL